MASAQLRERLAVLLEPLLRGSAVLVRQEHRPEVHHRHPAVLGEGPQHVVGHVAPVVGDGARRGMRCDDRRLRDLHHRPECLVGHMRDVDQHANALHLVHHLLAEWREPVMSDDRRPVEACRVGPLVRVRVGERHVAKTQPVERSQRVERVLDGVPALDAHERGDLSSRFARRMSAAVVARVSSAG